MLYNLLAIHLANAHMYHLQDNHHLSSLYHILRQETCLHIIAFCKGNAFAARIDRLSQVFIVPLAGHRVLQFRFS